MSLEVNIASPSGNEILLKVERLMYDISKDVNDSGRRAGRDESKIQDCRGSLKSISITGVLSTDLSSSATTKLQALIIASREWWLPSAQSTGDVSKWSRIKWGLRAYEYMMIERLEITDDAETDDHEFTYSLEIKIDTRE